MPDANKPSLTHPGGQSQPEQDNDEEFPKVPPFLTNPLEMDDQAANVAVQPPPVPLEDVQRVEEAIRKLREKMALVATEFAEGKINQAQFEAIYRRYQEQRTITESLLARDPKTSVWQQVLSEGPTSFLRSQHEARLEGYILYFNRTAKPILSHGTLGIEPQAIIATLRQLRSEPAPPQGAARCAKTEGDRWLIYVPGRHTTAIAIYSNQPTNLKLQWIGDLHRDFETANHRPLTAAQFSAKQLVYPQRALFKK